MKKSRSLLLVILSVAFLAEVHAVPASPVSESLLKSSRATCVNANTELTQDIKEIKSDLSIVKKQCRLMHIASLVFLAEASLGFIYGFIHSATQHPCPCVHHE